MQLWFGAVPSPRGHGAGAPPPHPSHPALLFRAVTPSRLMSVLPSSLPSCPPAARVPSPATAGPHSPSRCGVQFAASRPEALSSGTGRQPPPPSQRPVSASRLAKRAQFSPSRTVCWWPRAASGSHSSVPATTRYGHQLPSYLRWEQPGGRCLERCPGEGRGFSPHPQPPFTVPLTQPQPRSGFPRASPCGWLRRVGALWRPLLPPPAAAAHGIHSNSRG